MYSYWQHPPRIDLNALALFTPPHPVASKLGSAKARAIDETTSANSPNINWIHFVCGINVTGINRSSILILITTIDLKQNVLRSFEILKTELYVQEVQLRRKLISIPRVEDPLHYPV
jgi:hypothetical protein